MNKIIKFPVYKSLARTNSTSEYRLRAYLDQCIHDDVYDFVIKHNVVLERLIDLLLIDEFTHRRVSDSAYPQ